jgi:FkbM family methyltransferase
MTITVPWIIFSPLGGMVWVMRRQAEEEPMTKKAIQDDTLVSLPAKYVLYSFVHHLFHSLGWVVVFKKHPFLVMKTKINRFMYKFVFKETRMCIIRTKPGFLIKVPLNDQAAASIVFEKSYALTESHSLRKLLPHCTVFLDIGANLGYFSLLALSENRNLSVIAIEPNQELCDLMMESMHLNKFQVIVQPPLNPSPQRGEGLRGGARPHRGKREVCAPRDQRLPEHSERLQFQDVRVMCAAVGHKKGVGTLQLDRTLSSNTTVQRVAEGSETSTIDIVSIDGIFTEIPEEHTWLIKVDTEGSEIEVLKGSKSAMSVGAIFMCEVFHASVPALKSILDEYDYTILDHRGDIVAYEQLRQFKRTDVILVPTFRVEPIRQVLRTG